MSHQESADKREESETKSRPRNTFFVFLQEYRRELKNAGFTGLPATKISQLAGQRWRKMSDDQKLPYKIWARRNREQLKEYEMQKEIRKLNLKNRIKKIRPNFIN
ncbi:hypothetical protein GQX74_013350 [Glossina fuscipes]|nr:hypothetical protein GQX74_013350 [Glossina fuscipes]